jgi:hypothetical protein
MILRSDTMIGELVADLAPVRPLRHASGMAAVVGLAVLPIALIVLGPGVRADLAHGHPDPVFLVCAGVFAVLAMASAWSALDTARPSVGTRRDGWAWTAGMAAVLPVAAVTLLACDLIASRTVAIDPAGVACLLAGCAGGSLTALALVLWLRRGAPSSPRFAAMLTGVASGAAGIFAVSLWCPENDLVHIGIWHAGTVALLGAVGRWFLPRLLAW